MMEIHCKRCANDEDYAQVSLFMLKNRRDWHPSFTTVDVVTLVYSYITIGALILVMNTRGETVAFGAYYRGTPELDYQDEQKVVFVDSVIVAREYRSTRVFVRGFQYMLSQMVADNPVVDEFHFVALSENQYLKSLYSKFANYSHSREGSVGMEDVYIVEVSILKAFLEQFARL